MSYESHQPSEARFIRLETQLERERHATEMRLNSRIHELEMKMIRLSSLESKFDSWRTLSMDVTAILMIVITLIVIGVAGMQ